MDRERERERLFVEVLTMLQLNFKKKHGRFPNSQENNPLFEEAEKVIKEHSYGAGKSKKKNRL